MNSILYITSFNKKLYDVSGKNLLASFVKFKVEGDIFIGDEREGIEPFREIDTDEKQIQYWYDLSQNQFLNKWLEQFADIIPQYLGGKALPCSCKKPESRLDRDHKKGCYFSWWNRNCSRWFRKIACLDYIINTRPPHYTHLFWVDADCLFKQRLTKEFVFETCFRNNTSDIFFMLGQKRQVIETGLFGIQLNKNGLFFIEKLIEKYITGAFKGYCRWDDGYVFNKTRKQYSKVIGNDIGRFSNIIDVADECFLSRYITHFKGRHGRIMNIMK